MFAHINDVKLQTSGFDLDLLPKYRVLNSNDAEDTLCLTRQNTKVVCPLSAHFPNEENCSFDPKLQITVRLLTSDFERQVFIKEKLTDNESADQKDVPTIRRIPLDCQRDCLVDPRLRRSRERTTVVKNELDLPLPRFRRLPDIHAQRSINVVVGFRGQAKMVNGTEDNNQNMRSSMMESMLRSIPLLDVLSENEFREFSDKFRKFQQDIDAAVSKHHISHSFV